MQKVPKHKPIYMYLLMRRDHHNQRLCLFHEKEEENWFLSMAKKVYCWWTKESPLAHVAKFYSRLRLMWSVLRASKLSVLKLIEIVISWVYYTILLAWASFGTFWPLFFNFFNYFLWLSITDEGSVPEMRILSILLIKSDLKWCIHLSRSLYLYTNGKS